MQSLLYLRNFNISKLPKRQYIFKLTDLTSFFFYCNIFLSCGQDEQTVLYTAVLKKGGKFIFSAF
ncbi:MAG: hypothetical protein D3910_04270 [Candidatus Electrothrix sp. ATG2]|nr:hypothetical protein [Candidatus Electrothrix sp. ATG2]